MRKPLELNYVPLVSVYGASTLRFENYFPSTAGLYFWTLYPAGEKCTRLIDLYTPIASASKAARNESGRVGRRYDVTVRRIIPEHTENKLDILAGQVSQEIIDVVLPLFTCLQRPLYIGMSECISDRIESHSKQGSSMRQALASLEIELLDCAVTYVSFQADPSSSPTRPVLNALEAALIRLMDPILNQKLE